MASNWQWLTGILAVLVVAALLRDAAGANPWDPGVEKPTDEMLASPLYIRAVPPAKKAAVTFTVAEQMGIARKRAPVRGGIPFRRGELADVKHIRLLGPDGKEIPVQGLATSFWPEKTVRWLCIDFLTDIGAKGMKKFTLEYGTSVRPAKRSALKAARRAKTVAVDTGKMKVTFAPGERFCGRVRRAGGGTSKPVTGRLVISRGRETAEPQALPLTLDEVRLVESGPVQATIYLRGRYGGETAQQKAAVPKFAFHGFARVYGDTCRMEVVHSFGFNGDEDADFVRRYGLILPVERAAGTPFVFGGDAGRRAEAPLKKAVTLIQGRHDWWRLSGDSTAKGKRFGGWAALKTKAGHVTIALRNAWQQWPVMLGARADGELALWIYGAPAGEFLDLRYQGERFGKSKSMYVGPKLSDYYGGGNGKAAGLLKISELTIDFAADPADAGATVHVPLVPFAGAKRIAETKALGHTGTYEAVAALAAAGKVKLNVDEHIRWARALLDWPVIQHEANGYYGWVDWPDQGDCRRVKDGKFEMYMLGGAAWTNAERAMLSYYSHYAAGGLEKYLHLGHGMTLHTIGIDLEQPGGEMPVGTAHRHNQVHWRTGGEPRQSGVRGWYADYWMTGNPEVGRVLREVYEPAHCPPPGAGPDRADVTQKGASYNYPLLLAYLTWNDPVFIKHYKAIDEVILTAAAAGRGVPYSRGRAKPMYWKAGKITPVQTVAGGLGGYWCTYGGDDRLAEHASLFGYAAGVKALKAWGDGLFGEGRKLPGVRPTGYHSPEAGVAAYYLLTGNPRVPGWLRGQIGTRRGRTILKSSGPLIEWDSYTVKGTAEQWDRLWRDDRGRSAGIYGKNAFKIHAANIYESVYALAAIERAARTKK